VDTIPNIDHRFGDGRAEVIGIAILGCRGTTHLRSGAVFHHCGSHQRSGHRRYYATDRGIHDAQPHWAGFRRHQHRARSIRPSSHGGGDIYTVDFHLQLPNFTPRRFPSHPPSPMELHSYRTCDWVDNAIVLQMGPADGEVYGHIHLPCRVELNRCLVTRRRLSHAEPSVG
jgi:hypothetical protein